MSSLLTFDRKTFFIVDNCSPRPRTCASTSPCNKCAPRLRYCHCRATVPLLWCSNLDRFHFQLETVIYTSCGRCEKAIIVPGGSREWRDLPKGGYAYCVRCKAQTVKCAIW